MEKLQFYSSRVPYLPRLKQIAIKELSDYKVSLTGQNALYLYRLLVSSSDFYFLYSVDMLRFMNSLDEMSVYYLCKCTALVFGMSDAQQEILLKKHLNAKQLEFVYEQAFKDYYEHQASYELMLNESVATTTTNSYTAGFVETLELKKVLEDIKMGVSCHLPVLLQGPQGIGKTSLVEQVAHQNQVQGMVKIHLGDQSDGKMLLGTYMTTNTPGLFEWRDGVLTRAVKEGKWVLVEDIDSAPVDVLAVLIPLLETKWLHIPTRGERFKAKEGFQMFATMGPGTIVGENVWFKIQVPDLTFSAILEIVEKRFGLGEWSKKIVNVFEILKNEKLGRSVTIRDLVKWCGRIDSPTAETLFQEALDCFISMIPNAEQKRAMAIKVGLELGVELNRIEFWVDHYVPVVQLLDHQIRYGRVEIPAKPQKEKGIFAGTTASLRNLEKIAACVQYLEPVLLVGETGTGKTTIVQHLANTLGRKLTVVNMSQQSDSTDLLGGFKPVDVVMLATVVKDSFERVFAKTFSVKQNRPFLDTIAKAYSKKKWNSLVQGFQNAIAMARKVQEKQKSSNSGDDEPNKKRKIVDGAVFLEWDDFAVQVHQFKSQVNQSKQLMFSFVEGSLVKAIKNGDWILLDEINLATQETLECLSGLLQSATSSIMVLERGDMEPIKRHPKFRLFACMNPANDAGKRNLQPGFRSRFTEFWFDAPDSTLADLEMIIRSYMKGYLPPGAQGNEIVHDIATFYQKAKSLATNGDLFDGADCKVHISMRTLTRSLSYAGLVTPIYGLKRALYEGCFMTFMTGLNVSSFKKLKELVDKVLLNGVRNPTAFVKQIPPPPGDADRFVLIDSFWIEKGELDIPDDVDQQFVLTPSVQLNLANLARGCVSRNYPVLIQGPTSAGKTSMIEYLAKKTGHRFIRINNHEHTDLQEYLGGYMSNSEGALVFQEGVMVEALRKGYWVVLDELNLAPSDVLEALNRLLDDNRELYLAEKQETIKPHPHFMLFATQNPAGQYGGRKQLSRAFRNRFLELHFSDIPEGELETIIEKRCLIPPSYAKKLVAVYKQLCKTRDASKIFDGRASFITLRDLFRWALRRATGYQRLAEDGYMLLAERVRKPTDRHVIQTIIEKELKVKLDMDSLFSTLYQEAIAPFMDHPELKTLISSVVWTTQMKKLFVLIYTCKQFNEPVLLIGETGCGKTTVCQILAGLCHQKLHIVNAHQNSETSDFLGSQRPSRNRDVHEKELKEFIARLASELGASVTVNLDALDVNEIEVFADQLLHQYPDQKDKFTNFQALLAKAKSLFEWNDGPLVQAMNDGDFFLLDEISLADDSVLERLNSVLEPARQLTLVEKNSSDVAEITAVDGFHFFATMNPGGDYGKKELSPALRNRFTEIWVPQVSDPTDLLLIIEMKLQSIQPEAQVWAQRLLEFLEWFSAKVDRQVESIISLRDILAWAGFITNVASQIGIPQAFVHGGCMVLVDGIGVNPLFGVLKSATNLAALCRHELFRLAELGSQETELGAISLQISETAFGAPPFLIPFGPKEASNVLFSLEAPTTLQNCLRVLRAVQLKKPVLLEGSPGAGKTSLVSSLAAMSRHELVRINLSEQTDLMDLFGSDLPVEGGSGGEFAWRDGPFLKAMQQGEWVLLDELNLASQQVLEGLNACLDHRATVYVPELDKHFSCHPDFRVFAAQNPQSQGGGRKGLPKSFVNRFTLVYVDELNDEDLKTICSNLYPQLDPQIFNLMIDFNQKMKRETMDLRSFGWQGSPWEFNLRDVLRWLDLWTTTPHSGPGDFLGTLYVQRMRTKEDRQAVTGIFEKVFGYLPKNLGTPSFHINPANLIIGSQIYKRSDQRGLHKYGVPTDDLQILPSALFILESLLRCVHTRTMALLIGPAASGKSSLVRLLASLCGEKLEEYSMNPGVDALEILGGFEQVDLVRCEKEIVDALEIIVDDVTCKMLLSNTNLESVQELLESFKKASSSSGKQSIEYMLQLVTALKPLAVVDHEKVKRLEDQIADYQRLVQSDARGRFEWMDSTLVNALEYGHWILIDNVNLCSSSVLDRLNSLLEVGGALIMNERGIVNGEIKVIKPHPNFRIFMAMDPKHGEISRAMRNRAIELFVTDFEETSHSESFNALKILSSMGLPGKIIADRFVEQDCTLTLTDCRVIAEKLHHGQKDEAMELLGISTKVSSELFSYPTSYPDFIPGKLFTNDSIFANTLQQGSLLFHLLIDEKVDFTSIASVPKLPNQASLLEAALDWFVMQETPSNSALLKAWLRSVGKGFEKYMKAWEADKKELLSKILSIRNELLSFRGLEYMSNSLPINLLMFSMDFSSHPNFHMYCGFLEKLYLNRKVIMLQFETENVYSKAGKSLTPNTLLSQSSYLVHLRKVRVAALKHQGVQYFYSFVESMIQVLLLDIDITLAKRLFRIGQDFWFTIQDTEIKYDLITVLLKRISKIFQEYSDLPALFVSACKNLVQGFNLDRLESSSSLWKNSSMIYLIDPDLWTVGKQLEDLNSQIDFWKMDPQEWFEITLDATKWTERKRMIVEAYSTLFFLNDQTDMDMELFQVIKQVPEKLSLGETDSLLLPNLQTVEQAQQLCKQFLLWPIYDYNAISTKLQVLHNVLQLVVGEEQNFTAIATKLSSFLREATEQSSLAPLHFEPFQRLLWYFDSDSLKVSDESAKGFLKTILQNSLLQWHKALWKNGHSFWNTHLYDQELKSLINGEILPLVYKEVTINLEALENTVHLPLVSGQSGVVFSMLRNMEDVPLYSVESKLEQLKKLLQVNSSTTQDVSDLLRLDTDVLKFSLIEFFKSHSSLIGNVFENVKSAILTCDPEQLQSLYQLIDSVPEKYWSSTTKSYLQRVISLLNSLQDNGIDVQHTRGKAWTSYAIMFIQAYIPDYPIDPVEARKAKIVFLEKAFDSLTASVLVACENEYLAKGTFDPKNMAEKQQEISKMLVKTKKWTEKMPLRPEVSQIGALFAELSNLKLHILEISRIEKLVNDLASTNDQTKNMALQEEAAIQNTLDSILQRWVVTYPYYKDLLEPLYTCIYQLKFGLCLIKTYVVNAKSMKSTQTVLFLTDFMSVMDQQEIILPEKEQFSQLDLDVRLSVIKRIWFENETTSNTKYIPTLVNLFTDIANDWADAEEQRKKSELESESIYKTKEVHIETQDEYDEKKFRELFPDYAEEFADLDPDSNGENVTVPTTSTQDSTIYTSKKALEILDLFHAISKTVSSAEKSSAKKIWPLVYSDSFDVGVKTLEADKIIPTPDMDTKLRPGFVFMNQMRIKSIASALDMGNRAYDFYNDPNINESQRIRPVVLQYEKKLNMALEKWPEHDVLVNLATICKRLISFPVTSPIMKLLLGLELLLIKSHDWEAYSSKEYSLKNELDQIIKLIVSWRKLELETWRELLEIESRKCSEVVSSQWFHLWKIIIRALQSELDGDVEDVLLKGLLEALDQFFLSSTIGEFEARINLLGSFCNFAEFLSKDLGLVVDQCKIVGILSNVQGYYNQFLPLVQEEIEKLRKPILKELKEYVKIATWKDVNVFALKDSAKRTHYHLNKFVKKFRLGLQMKSNEVILRFHESPPSMPGQQLDFAVLYDKFIGIQSRFVSDMKISSKEFDDSQHLKRFATIDKLYGKSKAIALQVIEGSTTLNTAKGMEDLITEMVSQVKEFQSMNGSLQAGTQTAKGQKMIRKKLWVDFLKLLEEIGLNPRSTQKYILLQDTFYLHSRVTFENDALVNVLKDIVPTAHTFEVLSKAQTYYYRNLARLEAVRKLRINPSPEISKLEMDKAISFLDHSMNQSITQRLCLCRITTVSQELDRMVIQMDNISKHSSDWEKGNVKDQVEYSILYLQQLKVLIEKSAMCIEAMDTKVDRVALISVLRNACNKLESIHLYENKKVVVPTFNVLDGLKSLSYVSLELKNQLNPFTDGMFAFAIVDLLKLIDQYQDTETEMNSSTVQEFESLLEQTTEKTLIVIQHLSKPDVPLEETIENEFDLRKGEMVASSEHVTSLFSKAALQDWVDSIVEMVKSATSLSDSYNQLSEKLSSVFTIIHQARLLLFYRTYQLILFHKTWVKFSYLLSNNFYLIIKNGFCVPKTEEEEEEDETEQADGTGVGEGVGTKDVSKEIEDQEQVEGLQNEEQQQPDPEKNLKEEKDGVEMDNDFDGKMEDVSDDENEQDETDPKENEEPEEQMGDVDQDLADTVDEKMWGDDEDPKDQGNEKTEKDSSVEKGGPEDETVAKEEDSKEDSKEDPKDKEDPKESKKEPESKQEDDEEGPVNEDGNYEENHGIDVKEADDLDQDDDEMNDLPENLEFEDEGDDDQDDQMDLDDSPDGDAQSESSEMAQDQDDTVEKMPDDAPFTEMEKEDVDPQAEDQVNEENEQENQDVEEQEKEDQVPEEEIEQNDRAHGFGEARPEEEVHEQEEEAVEETNKTAQPESQSVGVEGDAGQQNVQDTSETQQEGVGSADNMQEQQENAPDEQGQTSSMPKQEESESQSRKNASESNPHRSVGNAMEQWLSRLRNISDSINENEQEKPKEGAEGDEFEFVKEDDQDQGDQQALGVAEKEQVEKMEKLSIDPTKEEVAPEMETDEMDLDDPIDDPAMSKKESENVPNEMQGVPSSIKTKETLDQDMQEVVETEEGKQDDQERTETETQEYQSREYEGNEEEENVEMEVEPLEIQDYDTFRMELEKKMAEWRQSGKDSSVSQELWRNYTSLTQDLSFSLCEQLRLILEPTLSTKLKGDYRTGKRLNMRKIISYIASQFKKDKIWLKRTKPSKRTYQIMIAIDDSQSMASSHSVQLAFESLTVLTTALNQLEAGDIAIVSFGEQVNLVHPFEKAWSDEAGAQVLQSFTFTQQKTFVKLLMDQSLEVLRHARMMQSSADLWQLEIILSDGICEDHDYIKNRVHMAAEEHIAMVFIILDTRSEKDSILNMSNVSYDIDPNTNMPILKMNRYMDTFPFDYYVLVRNVETLPEVLSDILRQFFMFIAS